MLAGHGRALSALLPLRNHVKVLCDKVLLSEDVWAPDNNVGKPELLSSPRLGIAPIDEWQNPSYTSSYITLTITYTIT